MLKIDRNKWEVMKRYWQLKKKKEEEEEEEEGLKRKR